MSGVDGDNEEAGTSEDPSDVSRLLKLLFADILRMVVVETRLFGHTALAMMALTILIPLLLGGAWLFAGAALVIGLTNLEYFSLPGALLVVAMIHLVFAALAFWRRRYITRDLMFRDSRASANSLLVHARAIAEAVAAEGGKARAETAGPDAGKRQAESSGSGPDKDRREI